MRAIVLTLIAGLIGSPPVLAGEGDHFDGVVDAYRKMIILADGATALEDGSDRHHRAVAAARHHYARQRRHLAALRKSARQAAPLTPSNRLLDVTERLVAYIDETERLRPGDLLAFQDLTDTLLRLERSRLGEGPEVAPIRSLDERIAGVLDDYREEYTQAMGELARGEGERESWDAYIAAISQGHSMDRLLQEAGDTPMVRRLEEMRRQRAQAASSGDDLALASPEVVYGHNLPDKTVALTFDDGPEERRTNRVLDILEDYGVHGYFFALGNKLGRIGADGEARLERGSATARRIVEAGHVLANHSFSHPNFAELSQAERRRQLSHTNKLIEKIGGNGDALFRPPYGVTDDALEAMTAERGMASVMWNVDSMDWADPVPESIVDRTIRQLEDKGSGILLFHDIHRQTVEALPSILDALAERDYRVVALDGEPLAAASDGRINPPEREQQLYDDSWAVVVGINDYRHWPDLEYAVNDARAVGDTLVEDLGFPEDKVIRLYDGEATRENIAATLGHQLADPDRVDGDDRVFVFFAGHGMTRPLPAGGSLGYIIPANARRDDYTTHAISMSVLQDYSRAIPAKHVLFVMDSCYSGLALTRAGVSAGETRHYLEETTSRRARQMLTAGGADEQVADDGPGGHSVFTWSLLKGLSGVADTDGNGYVSASELGTYLGPTVSSYADQTPVFGNLEGSEGGDFLFKVRADAAIAAAEEAGSEGSDRSSDDGGATGAHDALEQNLRERVESGASEGGELEAALAGGKPSEAERERASRLDAEALELFRAGDFEGARGKWRKAVQLDPYNPDIVNNYGYVLDKLGELDRALTWYYRTVELAPRRTPVYLNLGDLMVKMDRPREAVPYYRRYLHLYPSYDKAEKLRDKIERLAAQGG